ncbi:MAG: hypothetical protein AAB511_00895 [Patescibacteria group bacterium]
MSFNSGGFEALLGGSHTSFKKMERPALSEAERELKLENERKLQEGIRVLRKLRTEALTEQDYAVCQNVLKEAHLLSTQMANVIMAQSLEDTPSPVDPSFVEGTKRLSSQYSEQDAGSGHGLPPQFSIQNLLRATDDMLARVAEKAKSVETPNHKLTQEEMRYVLDEFLRGTNDLTINAVNKFFQKGTKVGGILSGGSVYVELVKKIVERYGDNSFSVDSFVIAVDKENQKAVSEAGESGGTTTTVIVADDMMDRGGTVITALYSIGETFPSATVYSGKGTDHPGGFEARRDRKFMNYLEMLFQDFAELSDGGRNGEALEMFRKAEAYANENKVKLQAGWYKRKERIEKSKKE